MRKHVLDFIRRGLMSWGLGPVVLAVIYGILHRHGVLEGLTVREVCTGILSLSALAFIAGGMNAIYQIERLPLMAAILIHGTVLYLSYLTTYLLNSWLELGMVPVLIFTGIFIAGYLVIWLIIYSAIKKKTASLNEKLKRSRERNTGSEY